MSHKKEPKIQSKISAFDALNPDQRQALELLQSGENIFLTGGAGCGKSFVIKHFVDELGPKQMPIFTATIQNPNFQNVQDVTPEQVKNAAAQIAIIDVRENEEWNAELGHIASAQLINLGTLPENISKVPKDKTVVFVCRSGGRSGRAAAFFKEQGYKDVYNMQGGMIQWNHLGLPVAQN